MQVIEQPMEQYDDQLHTRNEYTAVAESREGQPVSASSPLEYAYMFQYQQKCSDDSSERDGDGESNVLTQIPNINASNRVVTTPSGLSKK